MLDTVLDGTAPARLVLVHHSLAAPAAPLIRQLIARAHSRAQPTLAINLITRSPAGSSSSSNTLDLTAAIKGYSDVDVEKVIRDACDAMDPRTQVYIDAIDLLAEDCGTAAAYRVLRQILSKLQSPGRLILSLPTSPFYTDMISSTLSPSLAVLTPHAPRAVEALCRALLIPITDDKIWHHLSTASGDALALRGSDGADVSPSDAYVVQVLLRKATGGAKAMGRAVVGFRLPRGASNWEIVDLDQVVQAAPLFDSKGVTHADLALPFNLSLTDRQRAERGAVPLPYAHEGEGADLGMGMDWSDDEEDDEI